MKNIFSKIKKTFGFVSSRLFFLTLGLMLAVGVYVAQAAWNNTVTAGASLTSQMWNEIVNKLIGMDAQITSTNGQISTVNSQVSTMNTHLTTVDSQISAINATIGAGLSFTPVMYTNSANGLGHFSVTVTCGSGGLAVGGGCYDTGFQPDGGCGNTAMVVDAPLGNNGWRCGSRDVQFPCNRALQAYVICTR